MITNTTFSNCRYKLSEISLNDSFDVTLEIYLFNVCPSLDIKKRKSEVEIYETLFCLTPSLNFKVI
jgi:hypothetical protein